MLEFFKNLKPIVKIVFALCGTAVILYTIYATVQAGVFGDVVKWIIEACS